MNPEDLIVDKFRLYPIQKQALERLGLKTLRDLLLHAPSRYVRAGEVKNIEDLEVGEIATIYGKITKTKISRAFRKRIPMSEATIEDSTGKIKAVWFHQAYMVKKFPEGALVQIRGKVSERKGVKYLANPQVGGAENWTGVSENLGDSGQVSLFQTLGENSDSPLMPVYPESRGLSSNWIYHTVERLIKAHVHEKVADFIPEDIIKKYNLPKVSTAIVWAHMPRDEKDALSARKRFSFEEVFLIQLHRMKNKLEYQKNAAFEIDVDEKDIENFTSRFPFTPTKAQTRAIEIITEDFKKGIPMTRLLEGDVGSGKTAVAASTAFSVVDSGYEVGYMVPTEILAKQHFESFIQYFKHMPIQIGLITSSECRKFPSKIDPSGHTHISKPQLLKWVANGEIPIVIGTHSLIQKDVKFKNLAYVIIDEQHRFGVMQRAKLLKKMDSPGTSPAPHLLSMTATPIPRTLALTIYGDLDVTLLDEMPAGRKPVITEIVTPKERIEMYEKIREEVKKGRQAYVICPRIDEPDPEKFLALNAKSAIAEQKLLQEKVFPEFKIGLVHGKMKPKEKEEEMRAFEEGENNILVSTSVIEVGVNVPNATAILIEGAERFGLAQLHQLRGRVLRSTHQAYCFLATESKNERVWDRLRAIKTAKNGFELAEMDLKLRGAGLLSGERQWGLSDIGMEAIQNLKMVEAARNEAKDILEKGGLENYPELSKIIQERGAIIHFE